MEEEEEEHHHHRLHHHRRRQQQQWSQQRAESGLPALHPYTMAMLSLRLQLGRAAGLHVRPLTVSLPSTPQAADLSLHSEMRGSPGKTCKQSHLSYSFGLRVPIRDYESTPAGLSLLQHQ